MLGCSKNPVVYAFEVGDWVYCKGYDNHVHKVVDRRITARGNEQYLIDPPPENRPKGAWFHWTHFTAYVPPPEPLYKVGDRLVITEEHWFGESAGTVFTVKEVVPNPKTGWLKAGPGGGFNVKYQRAGERDVWFCHESKVAPYVERACCCLECKSAT